jgi:hypothetical protein
MEKSLGEKPAENFVIVTVKNYAKEEAKIYIH